MGRRSKKKKKGKKSAGQQPDPPASTQTATEQQRAQNTRSQPKQARSTEVDCRSLRSRIQQANMAVHLLDSVFPIWDSFCVWHSRKGWVDTSVHVVQAPKQNIESGQVQEQVWQKVQDWEKQEAKRWWNLLFAWMKSLWIQLTSLESGENQLHGRGGKRVRRSVAYVDTVASKRIMHLLSVVPSRVVEEKDCVSWVVWNLGVHLIRQVLQKECESASGAMWMAQSIPKAAVRINCCYKCKSSSKLFREPRGS